VQHFLEEGLVGVVQFCGHLGALTLDFFFWSYVKNYVYMGRIRDLNHLNARIREAAEQVTSVYGKEWNADWTHAGSRTVPVWKPNNYVRNYLRYTLY
jgi:hypothetical protein